MPLRYFIKQWLLPPGVLFLLLLAAWWLRTRRPRLAALCFALGLGGLWLMSLPLVVERAARQLETEAPLPMAQWATLAGRADAIVVLGAGRERGDPAWGAEDQPTGTALERMRYAAQLAKASGLPVLTTGGLHYGTPPSEAQLMADRMKSDFGVDVRWKEEASRTTWENAQFSAPLLHGYGAQRVVLVSSATHLRRASLYFAHFGIAATPVRSDWLKERMDWWPQSWNFAVADLALHEYVGVARYHVYNALGWNVRATEPGAP